MNQPLPNLFEREPVESAVSLYAHYLGVQLQRRPDSDWENMICACRAIRCHTGDSAPRAWVRIAFRYEFLALCELEQFDNAWKLLGLREEMQFGRRLDHASHSWQQEDVWTLEHEYCPMLYFRKEYPLGSQLLETALEFRKRQAIYHLLYRSPILTLFAESGLGRRLLEAALSFRKRRASYDLLYRVDNGEEYPPDHYRVTLKHFYTALGKDLRNWQDWQRFARGFHPLIYKRSGITAKMILVDPGQLQPLREWIRSEWRRRFPGNQPHSIGIEDLIGPEEQARATNAERQQRFEANSKRPKSKQDLLFEQYFPELA